MSLAIGMIGVLAAERLDRLVAFSVIGSMGMVMVSISLFTPAGIAAALYYIVHSTLAGAALFLISDLVRTGRANLELTPQPPMAGTALTAGLFFVGAIAMAGLPPLSGFLGKLLVLDAAFGTDLVVWIWVIVLSSSLISIVGFARAGSVLFWKAHSVEPSTRPRRASPARVVLCRGRRSAFASGGAYDLCGTGAWLHDNHRRPVVRARALYLHRGGHTRQAVTSRRRTIDMARAFHWLLPHPLLTLILAVVWTLLQNEVSAGMVVFGYPAWDHHPLGNVGLVAGHAQGVSDWARW